MFRQARQVATRVQKDLDYALQVLRALPEEQRMSFTFLYVRGTAGVFFVLGKGSGADDLIQAIGGKDVASEQNATKVFRQPVRRWWLRERT